MTLTPFSRSQEGSDYWKMACLHPISRMNGWILTKLLHLFCEMEKNLLDFGDLDPIFKVTQGLRLLENGLSAPYLMKERTDFDQTCTTVLLTWKRTDWSKEGSDCWKMAFLHSISRMNRWILTKLVELYCWDKDNNWLEFGDLDPIFKVKLGLRFWKMAPIDHTHTHTHTKINYRYNLFQ